jgi:hypothetical protein
MKFTVTAGAFANALALATLLGDDRRVKKIRRSRLSTLPLTAPA